jgi:cobalt-zinc-cadmium efflux system outer membrane protein
VVLRQFISTSLFVGALLAQVAHARVARAETLTLREAARLGSERGSAVARAEAPREAVAEAKRRANPLVLVPPELTVSVGARRYGAGETGIELGVSAIQRFSTGSLGRKRARTAELMGQLTERELAGARLDDAEQAALAWIDVAYAKQLQRLRQASLGEAEQLASSADLRVKSGVGQPIELAVALGEKGTALAMELDAEGQLTEAHAALRFATGLAANTPVDTRGELMASRRAHVNEGAIVKAAEERHPALRAASARAALAMQEAELVRGTHAPWFGVGAAYTREGTGDQIFLGVVEVPLPVVSAGAFDRARQRAAADVQAAEVAIVRREVARDIRLALHEREHTAAVLDAMLSGARKPLEEAFRLARVGYDVGTLDISAVLLARQRLLAAEEQVLRSTADLERAEVRLQRAAGTLIEGNGR